MKIFSSILCIFIVFGAFAQKPDAKLLEIAIASFDKALVNKDSIELKKLLNEKLSYGHSNGWIESKQEVIDDLFNGKLTYKKINPENMLVAIEGVTASARMDASIDVEMGGKPLSLKLKVLQVWIWHNKDWELLARQSVKM